MLLAGRQWRCFRRQKLKAVVAFKIPPSVASQALNQKTANCMKNSPIAAMQGMKKGGTHAMAAAGGYSGKVPTAVKNITKRMPNAEDHCPIREEAFKNWEVRRAGCIGCVIQCLHAYRLPGEGTEDTQIEGMHANSVRGFGPNLGVSDPRAILRMHWLANENGIDVDGLSSSLAFALECAEHGILEKEQSGGVSLEWGDGESLQRLTGQIVRREGLGAVLAEGAYRAAELIGKGSQEFAMTTKKVGINEQGIRSHRAWAIGIMTSNRGGVIWAAPAGGKTARSQ
jgi:aldehyde:ferredoxin oxidoreductase